ncbi:hypothetical protein [Arundinibacter roseus]|uniref:Uncharacterized protein n=1 Tax=Arundinibacter roseus TaxID=2070510 RepID=A0A4R4KCX9_9BACT|nr:hypothetical protein [Arundinibacter roseus]TDB64626.1 hypothetical protein EZE20_13225 [Arundinibacter roseus]
MKQFLLFISALLLSLPSAFGHVGSSGVLFQGQAGDYRVLVSVQPPDVIPGTAQITVYVESGRVSNMYARPIYFSSGDEGAPSPDELLPVDAQKNQYQGIVWLMEGGSSSVQIDLDGTQGKAELIVPIAAVSTAERDMPAGLGWTLSALGLLLVVLMVTIIGASVSDGLLRPGQQLSAKQRRKRLINMGIAFGVCVLILYGGSSWWDSWASDYKQYLYKPLQAKASIIQEDGQWIFEFKADTASLRANNRKNALNYLIPDHGKLMHLFLVRVPGLDAFAHLHPERADSTTFRAFLPALPAGKYLAYGDIVHYSGFTETITDTIDIPAAPASSLLQKRTDPEDTYVVTDPLNNPKNIPLDENVVICGQPGTKTKLKDGSYVIWEGKASQTFEAGKPYSLRFEVFAPDGTPAELQSYLGMPGHAAIVRSDGSVYIHLHPVGTYAMAAELTLKNRIADTSRTYQRAAAAVFRDSIDRQIAFLKTLSTEDRETYLMKEMGMSSGQTDDSQHTAAMNHGSSLSFPYAFPKAGSYRIFLQIKRNGTILTGVFDAKVIDSTTF